METKDTQSIPHQEFTHTTATTTTTASAATNEEPQSQQLQQLPALQLHQTDNSSTVAQSDYEYSNIESSFSNPYLIPQIQPNNNNNNRNNYQQSVTPSNQPPPPSLQPPTTSSLPPAPPPLLSQYQHYSSHDDLTRVQNPPLELKQSHSVPSVPTVRSYFGQQQQQQPVSSDHLDQMHSVVTTQQQQQQLQNQNHSYYTSTSTNNIPSTSSTTSTPSHTNQQLPFQVPTNIDVNQYPDMTTLVNSNANIVVPMVENRFVDHKVCSICGKRITRDMSRHMRTHQTESRFNCKFPKNQCRHKSGRFNRPYDFKKHLLNRHFKFDDPSIKRLHNLSDKLNHWGTCPCGLRFSGRDWLDEHILTEDPNKKCPFIE